MRTCGECSLCCKLFAINALSKPANVWCKHALPGKGGCSIYADRPQLCRTYSCWWLTDLAMGDEWYPFRSKIVAHFGFSPRREPQCVFTVDPGYPDRWRESPYYDQIKVISLKGLTAAEPAKFFYTAVHTTRKWLILPNKDVDVTEPRKTALVQVGEQEWDCVFL
jgi:hypothetical protein